MKLIIDISEEDYKECKFRNDLLSLGGKPTDLTFNMLMETLIAEGTPLQAELEYIKAEVDDLKCYGDQAEFRDKVFELLDKRIKEIEE